MAEGSGEVQLLTHQVGNERDPIVEDAYEVWLEEMTERDLAREHGLLDEGQDDDDEIREAQDEFEAELGENDEDHQSEEGPEEEERGEKDEEFEKGYATWLERQTQADDCSEEEIEEERGEKDEETEVFVTDEQFEKDYAFWLAARMEDVKEQARLRKDRPEEVLGSLYPRKYGMPRPEVVVASPKQDTLDTTDEAVAGLDIHLCHDCNWNSKVDSTCNFCKEENGTPMWLCDEHYVYVRPGVGELPLSCCFRCVIKFGKSAICGIHEMNDDQDILG